MKPIRIISYNILFGKRITEILRWLKTVQTQDILCFQEFPQHRISECLEALSPTRYSWAFAPSLFTKTKTFGELTLWKTATFGLKEKKILSLGQSRIEKVTPIPRTHRTALITTFLKNNHPFLLTNLQLSSLSLNAVRYQQLQRVINETERPHIPIVLIGDFNYPTMRANHKLNLFMKERGFEPSPDHFSTYKLGPVRYQLDYVFTKSMRIETFDMVRLPHSDHNPVFATIQP